MANNFYWIWTQDLWIPSLVLQSLNYGYYCYICTTLLHQGQQPYSTPPRSTTILYSTKVNNHILLYQGQQPYSTLPRSTTILYSTKVNNHTLLYQGQQPYSTLPRSATILYSIKVNNHILLYHGQQPYTTLPRSLKLTNHKLSTFFYT